MISSTQIYSQVPTRYWGAKSNKSNGIDAIFEVDEAAEMSGNIANNGSAGANHNDRTDEGEIPIEKT